MAKYIDRDALLEHIKKDPLFDLVERYGISGVIESFPAADVRPVVTCSECMYAPFGTDEGFDLEWPHDDWPENNPCPCKCDDGWYSYKPNPEFYCANGKREES